MAPINHWMCCLRLIGNRINKSQYKINYVVPRHWGLVLGDSDVKLYANSSAASCSFLSSKWFKYSTSKLRSWNLNYVIWLREEFDRKK